MLVEDLTRRRAGRHQFASFHRWLTFVDDRIEFGAGDVLAHIDRWLTTGEIDVFFAWRTS
jgi:hypothetical protein